MNILHLSGFLIDIKKKVFFVRWHTVQSSKNDCKQLKSIIHGCARSNSQRQNGISTMTYSIHYVETFSSFRFKTT